MMFSETKVTEIYRIADDFCKEIAQFQENIWLNEYSMPAPLIQLYFQLPFYHNNILFLKEARH